MCCCSCEQGCVPALGGFSPRFPAKQIRRDPRLARFVERARSPGFVEATRGIAARFRGALDGSVGVFGQAAALDCKAAQAVALGIADIEAKSDHVRSGDRSHLQTALRDTLAHDASPRVVDRRRTLAQVKASGDALQRTKAGCGIQPIRRVRLAWPLFGCQHPAEHGAVGAHQRLQPESHRPELPCQRSDCPCP